MKARYRDLTAKYKSFRSQPDSLFLSRNLQTLFNKFTKKGKKALARRHLLQARLQIRLSLRATLAAALLKRTLRYLEAPLDRLYSRKGKERTVIPVPMRRNKKKSAGIQSLYNSIQRRRERDFFERIQCERLCISGPMTETHLGVAYSERAALLHEERTNLKRRWR